MILPASAPEHLIRAASAANLQDNFGRFSQAAFDARVVGVWEGTVNKAQVKSSSPNSGVGRMELIKP